MNNRVFYYAYIIQVIKQPHSVSTRERVYYAIFFDTSYFLLPTFTSYFLPGYYYSHCYTCIVTLVLLPLYFCHCSWSSALAYQYISLYIHMRRHNWFVKFLCRCIMIPEPKTKEAVVSVKFSVNFDVWLPPTNPKLTRAHQPRLEEQ